MAKRILLVDDDPNIQDTAKDILEDAGYTVEAAGTSAAALKALASHAADLAIIDLNLPDGNGVDLAVKAKAVCPKIVLILMTGQAEDASPAGLSARQKGYVDDYLVKPVSPAQLLKLLERLLS